MFLQKPPRLWLSSARPNQLVNALAAVTALRERFTACHFICEQSSWWDHADWDKFRPAFDKVVQVNRVRTCRGVRDVRRFENDLRARQDQLRSLDVAPEDVLICICDFTNLSNAIVSAFPTNRKLLLATRKAFVAATRKPDFLRYRFTTSGALAYFYLQPKLGLNRTLHLKPWLPAGGDGARIVRPEQDLRCTYDAVILWSNQDTPAPPATTEDVPRRAPVHISPWPNLADAGRTLSGSGSAGPQVEQARGTVVFFGTPFLLVRNLPPPRYAEVLNGCFDYLRKHYAPSCRLLYRPHPAETSEKDHLQLHGFDLEADGEVAELYFLKRASQIEAVYSVSSTVSRVAFNYGLNAYALWPCFPFKATAREYFRTLMDSAPPGFHIDSLEKAPVAYSHTAGSPAGLRFADVLNAALDRLPPLPGEPAVQIPVASSAKSPV